MTDNPTYEGLQIEITLQV